MRLISVERQDGICIRVMGRAVFEVCSHLLFRLNYSFVNKIESKHSLSMKQLTKENLENEIRYSPFSRGRMKDYLNHPDLAEGFCFHDVNGCLVGFLWLMYPGANEFQYRIRNVPVFGCDFCVYESFRGKEIIQEMVKNTMDYLYDAKGIGELYACVRPSNAAAIRAYEKLGMTVIRKKHFVRVMGLKVCYERV